MMPPPRNVLARGVLQHMASVDASPKWVKHVDFFKGNRRSGCQNDVAEYPSDVWREEKSESETRWMMALQREASEVGERFSASAVAAKTASPISTMSRPAASTSSRPNAIAPKPRQPGYRRTQFADEYQLARSERFELPTLGIEIRCSIQLSYERVVSLSPIGSHFSRASNAA